MSVAFPAAVAPGAGHTPAAVAGAECLGKATARLVVGSRPEGAEIHSHHLQLLTVAGPGISEESF